MCMTKNPLLDAASMSASVVGERKDSAVNVQHMITMLAKTYARAAKYFINVAEDKIEDTIRVAMNDESILCLFAKKGKVTDADCVSISEAVRWTAHYMSTGEKLKIIPVLIEPSEVAGKTNMDGKHGALWNAFITEHYPDVDTYDYIRLFDGAEVQSLRILDKSKDKYEVLLKK